MLFVLRGVAKQRFSMFSVFMVIPTTLVRRLAVSLLLLLRAMGWMTRAGPGGATGYAKSGPLHGEPLRQDFK
jgi:hypothetical protein